MSLTKPTDAEISFRLPVRRVGKCWIPTCDNDLPQEGARLCDSCDAIAKQQKTERLAREAKEAAYEGRLVIGQCVQAAIPARYVDVLDPDQLTDPDQQVIALQTLGERLACANFREVVAQTMDAADFIIGNRGAFVLFTGPSGVGKSSAMAYLLRLIQGRTPLVPRRQNPVFAPMGLFRDNRDVDEPFVRWASSKAIFQASKNENTYEFEHAALLAIDDIGREAIQANVGGVPDVIWTRYEEMLTSVATTGFVDLRTPHEDTERYLAPLAERYGTAFVRRVAQLGPKFCRIIALHPIA